MLGAIAGDIIGSVFEGNATKSLDFPLFHEFCRFTDDTVLTVAVADWILNGGELIDLLHDYFHAWPDAGFGGTFLFWAARRERQPYRSWGNGAAMRVSPVGFAFDSLEQVLDRAEASAAVTHNHPEGIRGAQATAAAIFLARTGTSKREIRDFTQRRFGYDMDQSLDELRPTYHFDVSCQGSVPQSIVAFLESEDYESAVRNAVSLGGDADTMACIAGGIAEAFYGGVPESIASRALEMLDKPLRDTTLRFRQQYMSETA